MVQCKTSVHAAPLMFAGRFYCTTENGVMLLETSEDQPPHMEVAARLRKPISAMRMDSAHLVNNNGELMLVHRKIRYLRNRTRRRMYDVYKVDLDTGTLFPVKSLGGRALFMGMYCSLSVSADNFPSICGDTIYLSFDLKERAHDGEIEAYHLPNG
uniref:KIB1-4 beta-propeller domain-containing protein n=1 Tax=Triticum urartu TaxID=4572 RepID=A0A8R7UY44_TRIUA